MRSKAAKHKKIPVDEDEGTHGSTDYTACSYCEIMYYAADSPNIKCDICQNIFHQECTGLSSDVFNMLLGIINQTGWVCQECRIQRNELVSECVVS